MGDGSGGRRAPSDILRCLEDVFLASHRQALQLPALPGRKFQGLVSSAKAGLTPGAAPRRLRGQGKPETFDFLGFTHCCGRKRQSRVFCVKRKTMSKRLRAKLQAVRAALLRRRHEPLSPRLALACLLPEQHRGEPGAVGRG